MAAENARLKPDYWFPDIEVWNWQGPIDAEKCTRCQADFAKSGCATWEEWKLQKGYEMWTALANSVRDAVKTAGGPEVILGVYDWTAQSDYQFTWPFMRMYPEYLQTSQPSTYTPLYPYHIALAGDEAQRMRSSSAETSMRGCRRARGCSPADLLPGAARQFSTGNRDELLVSRVRTATSSGAMPGGEGGAPVEDIIADGTGRRQAQLR